MITYLCSINPKELHVIFLRRWTRSRIQRGEIHLKYKIDFVVFLQAIAPSVFNRTNVLAHDWRNANFLKYLANQRIYSLLANFNVTTRQECIICPDFVSNQDTTIQNTDSSNEIVKVHQMSSIVSGKKR